MKQSENIAALAKALNAVHKNVTPIAKDRTNSHFGNSYATLDSMMESVRPILAGEGLSIVQGGAGPVSNVDGQIVGVSVETMLLHVSGEYVSSIIVLPLDKPSAQAVGSAVTYGRRYGVGALLALTTEEDDDGHVATANAANATPKAAPRPAAAPAKPLGGGAPSCPKCKGAMWDNRADNDARARDGKKLRPDWSCKDAPKERGAPGCIGVIWRPDPKPELLPDGYMESLDDEPVPF